MILRVLGLYKTWYAWYLIMICLQNIAIIISINLFSLEYNKSDFPRLTNCKTSNIDIFLIPHFSTSKGLELLWKSIQIFMPCRGNTHFFIEPNDSISIHTLKPYWDESIKIHPFPDYMLSSGIRGYILQDWLKMWADNYTTAEYIMFFDTDSVLTLPTHYNSLFHQSTKKIYLPYWNMNVVTSTTGWPVFKDSCTILLGKSCDWEFMAYFPMTIPRSILEPMRSLLTLRMQIIPPDKWDINPNVTDTFDNAFVKWFPNLPMRHNLCFLTVIGNYLFHFKPDLMHLLFCPRTTDKEFTYPENRECVEKYIHPGIHYGCRYCWYLDSGCSTPQLKSKSNPSTGKFNNFEMETVREVISYGYCYQARLNNCHKKNKDNRSLLHANCTKTMTHTIHPEARSYYSPQYAADRAIVDKQFTPPSCDQYL